MLDGQKYKIITDSREQNQLWTDNIIVKKLDVGDYSIEGYEDKISIERKSLIDAFHTLGADHERFKCELERAHKLDYFAIIVEGNLNQIVNKDFPAAKYTKMPGDTIIKILVTLHIKYKINFFLVNDRTEARKLIKEIFESYLKHNITQI